MIEIATEQEAELVELRAAYILETPPTIAEFLNAHPHVPGLLLQAVAPLKRTFGADATIHLKLRTDGESEILYALVPWTGPSQEARKSLESFENSWWFAHADHGAGDIAFDYELT